VRKVAKFFGWTIAIGVAIALIASIVVLVAAQFHVEAHHAIISIGDTEIAVHGLFEQPVLTIIVAWLAVAGAFLVAGIGVLFALVLATLAVIFALGITAVTLGGVALLLALPFLALTAVIWLIVRNSRKPALPPPPPTPPAAV
jgi:hypothetical protein